MRSQPHFRWLAVVAAALASVLVLLGLPAAASAAVSGITVQRVWTDKASYAPGETIRFNAEIDNSLGGTLLAQGHCSANSFPVCLSISTSPSFFTNGRSADFPPGASTWSWSTTAPSSQGQYTFKVTAFDGFNGNFSERTASFTVGSSSGARVTVSRTYVANEKWAEAKRFSRGDLVRYQIVVSASAKVKINARMLVTGPQSRTILDSGGDIGVSPSTGSVYFQSTIPRDAPLGTYTEKATVTFSGQSTVRTSTFSVTQATGTPATDKLPYLDQYQRQSGIWSANCDCGPASAAMVIAAYTNRSVKNGYEGPFLKEVRDDSGHQGVCNNKTGVFTADLNFNQIEAALQHKPWSLTYAEISNSFSADNALAQIKAAVYAGKPVIALVYGADLTTNAQGSLGPRQQPGRGNNYGGHFVVVKAVSTTTVTFNDPDNQTGYNSKEFPYWLPGGPDTHLSVGQFKKALTDATRDDTRYAISVGDGIVGG